MVEALKKGSNGDFELRVGSPYLCKAARKIAGS